jgi:hypothetical protein
VHTSFFSNREGNVGGIFPSEERGELKMDALSLSSNAFDGRRRTGQSAAAEFDASSRATRRRRRILCLHSQLRPLSPASAAGEDEQRWI